MSDIIIRESESKERWEQFLMSVSRPPFLQSWNMKQLHEKVGEDPYLFEILKGDDLIGVAFATLVKAKRGTYLFMPYGPVFRRDEWKHLNEFTTYVKDFGKKLNADFLRSSPFIMNSPENKELYHSIGWKDAPIHMLAENIWWMDISGTEDELMKGMRKTMRNLVRRASKDGVVIKKSTSDESVQAFIDIHQETVQRHGFVPYTDDYFRAQVRAFATDGQVEVFIGEYENKPISAAIMMYYGDMASYHHGASLSEYNRIPASYLIQWEAIKEAKERGCTQYNFWGIVPESKQVSTFLKRKHPWIGLSKFKMGFGGSQLDLLHCQDYPLSWKYTMTKVIETARRIKRGY
ncbi:MAG: peptidoglycan bridge formation glycyltransferase FemA/FemB family protein [Candidatus Kerfeldbacteria bacterium]